ncbi:hypothetical protein NDU88_001848 [Pleurodeles waltl]|uniref:Uncharacterized protein n=1 Tax=Pleurodeles waltl TaxID=8319 RepID=A0AAV7S8S6_PLEWA|nr:hypothetical protein NDU88_001848 [Pleurodeles waltl]
MEDLSRQKNRGRSLIGEQEADGTIKEGQTSWMKGGAEDTNTEPREDCALEDKSGGQKKTQFCTKDKEEKDPQNSSESEEAHEIWYETEWWTLTDKSQKPATVQESCG